MLGELISNLLFCSIFALAGVNHVLHFERDMNKLVEVGVPQDLAPYCFGLAIGLLFIGTLLIISKQLQEFGYICYIAFLIPVTWFMHIVPCISAKYATTDPNSAQVYNFNLIQTMKNISLLGACLKFILNEFDKANKDVKDKKANKQNKRQKNKQNKKHR